MLIGLNSSDPLIGDANNNTLIAGAGAYTLTGGAGADRFVLRSAESHSSETADLITDFNPSEGDRIVLGGKAFPGLSRIRFKVATSTKQLNKLSSKKANIIYATKQDALYFDANGNKRGLGSDGGMFAVLSNGNRPFSNSFVLDPNI